MNLMLDANDISGLSPSARAELMALVFRRPAVDDPANSSDLEWDDVIDFTPELIEEFMEGCSDKTIAGLRVFAEHGPVISAALLKEAGIDNYGQFQGAITRRTRTVTGDSDAFMFTWDDWQSPENTALGYGHYAVTATTHRSLRGYFGLS